MPFVDIQAEQDTLNESLASPGLSHDRVLVGKSQARKRLLAVSIMSEMEKNGRTLAVVTKPYAYQHDLAQDKLVIPVGFVTDFASIPSFLWWFIQPFGRHALAAVIHDYLYALKQPQSRRYADHIFNAAMKESNVPGFRRRVMYVAVRLFGGKAFRKNSDLVFVNPEYGDPVQPPEGAFAPISWTPWKEYRALKRRKGKPSA